MYAGSGPGSGGKPMANSKPFGGLSLGGSSAGKNNLSPMPGSVSLKIKSPPTIFGKQNMPGPSDSDITSESDLDKKNQSAGSSTKFSAYGTGISAMNPPAGFATNFVPGHVSHFSPKTAPFNSRPSANNPPPGAKAHDHKEYGAANKNPGYRSSPDSGYGGGISMTGAESPGDNEITVENVGGSASNQNSKSNSNVDSDGLDAQITNAMGGSVSNSSVSPSKSEKLLHTVNSANPENSQSELTNTMKTISPGDSAADSPGQRVLKLQHKGKCYNWYSFNTIISSDS